MLKENIINCTCTVWHYSLVILKGVFKPSLQWKDELFQITTYHLPLTTYHLPLTTYHPMGLSLSGPCPSCIYWPILQCNKWLFDQYTFRREPGQTLWCWGKLCQGECSPCPQSSVMTTSCSTSGPGSTAAPTGATPWPARWPWPVLRSSLRRSWQRTLIRWVSCLESTWPSCQPAWSSWSGGEAFSMPFRYTYTTHVQFEWD